MDKFSKKKRSEIMSKIRSSNTKFEERFVGELKKRTNKRDNWRMVCSRVKEYAKGYIMKKRVCIYIDKAVNDAAARYGLNKSALCEMNLKKTLFDVCGWKLKEAKDYRVKK